MEEVLDDFISSFWQNDRYKELERLAEEYGWEFTPRARFSEQATALKGFSLFKGKRGKRITGILSAPVKGIPCHVRIYDYVYYSDGGKKKTTVIELTCEQIYLSRFHIKPKKGITNIFNLGNRKKGSTGLEKFSAHYHIDAADPESTDIQIPDSALGLIANNKDVSLEGEGHLLLYYSNRKLIPAHELLSDYEKAVEIMDRLLHDREKEFV
ncbi:MAG TPA: hypothetical protein VI603_15520 [Saprospiraceae bacterium]|nr:hypothetical protein [Saprospiraceae bacterium]